MHARIVLFVCACFFVITVVLFFEDAAHIMLVCVLVIVFAVPWHALRMYLLIAHELGMAEGDFAFICVHSDVRVLYFNLHKL